MERGPERSSLSGGGNRFGSNPRSIANRGEARRLRRPEDGLGLPAESSLSSPTVASVKEAVRTAFSDRPYPGDDGLLKRQSGSSDAELEEARGFFLGRRWSEVLEEADGVTLRDTMRFLSWDGFAYYLPALALLSVDVEDPGAVDDQLVSRLRSAPEKVSGRLDPAQRRAAVSVLRYLAGEYRRCPCTDNPAQEALDEFWASLA